jgi:hypothetical protein
MARALIIARPGSRGRLRVTGHSPPVRGQVQLRIDPVCRERELKARMTTSPIRRMDNSIELLSTAQSFRRPLRSRGSPAVFRLVKHEKD